MVGDLIPGRHLAISGDILVATLGWHWWGSGDAVVCAEQPSVTKNCAAQTVQTIFKCWELKSHASRKDLRACAPKSFQPIYLITLTGSLP